MSSKIRLFPQSSTEEISWQLPIQGSWGSVCAESRDVQFLRSWLVYDSNILTDIAPRPLDWNKLLGLAISAIVSVGIWVAVGMAFARLWK
jgi:hypothetical protein